MEPHFCTEVLIVALLPPGPRDRDPNSDTKGKFQHANRLQAATPNAQQSYQDHVAPVSHVSLRYSLDTRAITLQPRSLQRCTRTYINLVVRNILTHVSAVYTMVFFTITFAHRGLDICQGPGKHTTVARQRTTTVKVPLQTVATRPFASLGQSCENEWALVMPGIDRGKNGDIT